MNVTFASLTVAGALVLSTSAEVVVTLRGSEPEGAAVKVANVGAGMASSTSARFKSTKAVVNGVMETNRDFGQTFTTGAEAFVLDRITVKLGEQAIAASVFGAEVSVQIFEISGHATVNDNGTTTGKLVPWSDDPRVDDFIEGETYAPLTLARTGRLPAFLVPGQFMVLNFLKADRVKLKPNTQYGYLFMFDSAAPDRSLSFATVYWSDYSGGHAIRREISALADMAKRAAAQPTTKAGNKSDVFSDGIFWVEGSEAAATASVVTSASPTDAWLPLPRR